MLRLGRGKYAINAAINHLSSKETLSVSGEIYNKIKNNIVLLKAIDTGTEDGKISLENIGTYGLDALVSIKTSRNQIQILFPEYITTKQQGAIIQKFNKIIEEKRNQYFSLFMTNFRDKNRKRISFGFAYNLINNIYYSEINGTKILSDMNVKGA